MGDKLNLSKEELQKIVSRVMNQAKESPPHKVVATVAVASVQSKEEKEKALRAKLKEMEMQKLADSLKCEDRLAHIKSAGNGL